MSNRQEVLTKESISEMGMVKATYRLILVSEMFLLLEKNGIRMLLVRTNYP
jgi:hypothetical protein